LPRKTAIASGESRMRKSTAWDESRIGAARNDAPVDTCDAFVPIRHNGPMPTDLICRTAGYVTRTSGGVGGRGREASSYPDYAAEDDALINRHELSSLRYVQPETWLINFMSA